MSMTNQELINLKLNEIQTRCSLATQGPWEWTWGVGGGPQLEGSIYAPDMNPILIARGCGNNKGKGCFPDGLDGDELKTCPLHPHKEDRDFIVASRVDIPKLVEALKVALGGLRKKRLHMIKDILKGEK